MKLPNLAAALVTAAFLSASCGTTSRESTPTDTGTETAAAVDMSKLEKDGFVVEIEDGRLWVLRPGQEKDEKCITWVGAGPDGMTLRAPDADTALAYLATKPGFRVEIEDGRVWVLRGDQEVSEKCVTRIGAGPKGATVKAADRETLQAWIDA